MQNHKPNIAIICGGDSSEYVISVKSGQNVYEAIDRKKFVPWLIQLRGDKWEVSENGQTIGEVDRSDFSLRVNREIIRIDFAYITIHGTPGEDGILQGYFDLLKIPYSTGSVSSSALTFNKWHCNNFLRNFGVRMAKTIKLNKGETIHTEDITAKLGMPVFVKPNAAGSSFGVTKVKQPEDLEKAVRNAWEESHEALIDQFISGTEFTCGVMKSRENNLVFPVTEVLPKNEFFDFEAKYTPGVTEEITPARLSEKLFIECQYLSSRIYDWCGCSGIVRMDYILHKGKFYFLEVNTTPGMTATSFIPQQIKAMDKTLTEILTLVINEKLKSR